MIETSGLIDYNIDKEKKENSTTALIIEIDVAL